MNNNNYFVYILECSDKSLYCGITNNLNKRIAAHNAGKASKYTRSKLPVKLIYFESGYSKSDALKREYAIKQLDHNKKLQLIKSQTN